MKNSMPALKNKMMKAAQERDHVLGYLERHGIPYTTPHDHQIKVADLSFYPSTGTILRDGQSRYPQKGAAAFVRMLRQDTDGYESP